MDSKRLIHGLWRSKRPFLSLRKASFWRRGNVGVSCHLGTTSHNTYSGLHSFPITTPYLSVFTSDNKKKPRICSINVETFVAPSLEDIVLEPLQSINTHYEEIPEDPLSEGNPWPDLGSLNKALKKSSTRTSWVETNSHLLQEHFLPGSLRMS